jgi:hypothetical protein
MPTSKEYVRNVSGEFFLKGKYMSTYRSCSVLAAIVSFVVWIFCLSGTNEPVTKTTPGELYQSASLHVGIEEIYKGFRR